LFRDEMGATTAGINEPKSTRRANRDKTTGALKTAWRTALLHCNALLQRSRTAMRLEPEGG